MLEVFEIIERLSKQPAELIEYALIEAFKKGLLDYSMLSSAYVKYLESINDDKDLKLIDANACTLALLSNFKKETKTNHPDIHWALYNLNKSKQFNMATLNEKFGYNEENDREYSSYYRSTKP